MPVPDASLPRRIVVWALLGACIAVPVTLAAGSPLLAYRDPVYVVAGFAGVAALGMLLAQPVLAGGYAPGLSALRSRRLHRAVGTGLVLAVVVHVAALWLTSPPDVIDALLFASPTPFSVWGVIAMWAVFAAAIAAAARRALRRWPGLWRALHVGLASVVVTGSVAHAWLVFGTMEPISKGVLCAAVVAATAMVLVNGRRAARR